MKENKLIIFILLRRKKPIVGSLVCREVYIDVKTLIIIKFKS